MFSAGNVLEEAQFDPIGVMFICGALMADAVIGNVQEYVLKTFRTTTAELMFYTKFYGLLMLFVALVITGTIFTDEMNVAFFWVAIVAHVSY